MAKRRPAVALTAPCLIALLSASLASCQRGGFADPPKGYRAFSASSYWNTPLPDGAPVDPRSAAIIAFLRADNSPDFIQLNGVDRSGFWGNPIYWAGPDDPTTRIRNTCGTPQPKEFRQVRIPADARPDPTPDAAMTVYDLARGMVYATWHTRFNPRTGTWSACGGTVFYLDSNGLDGRAPGSDQPRNIGHRGVPPPTFAVRWAEIQAGSINHVLKIAVNNTACSHVFPMVDDECGTRDPAAPPEGARIRIKPSVDLRSLGLSRAALLIATALQRYGAVIGDQSGGRVNLKVENLVAEERGWLWHGVLRENSLAAIPLQDYEIVALGYRPTT